MADLDSSSAAATVAEPLHTRPVRSAATLEDSVVVLGLSHKTASVEVREKLAVPEHQWKEVGRQLTELEGVAEAAVLSTCNRFEIYLVASAHAHGAVRQVTEFLHRRSGVPIPELRNQLFVLGGGECVWHALRVSAGLDSLVVGEGQILSQMKRCYEIAADKDGPAGKVLGRMLNTAVSAGKRIRAETSISRGGVSISSAAAELVEAKCEGDLGLTIDQLDICILGAGKMGRLLVQHLAPRGVRSITVINRSVDKGLELAAAFPDAHVRVGQVGDMLHTVGSSHVTFACTSATEPIIYRANLEPELRRKVMLVDISVPRNIDDQALNELPLVCAYNVDDLKSVVAANQARRRRLMEEAEELLKQELGDFSGWFSSLKTVPMINKLQSRAESIRMEEFKKADRKLKGLSPGERESVERLTRGIVNKLLHGPMTHLRSADSEEDKSRTVSKVQALFNLGDSDE